LEFKIVVGGVQKAVRSKAAVGIWRIRSDVVVKTIADALDIKHTPQRPLTALILQVVDDVIGYRGVAHLVIEVDHKTEREGNVAVVNRIVMQGIAGAVHAPRFKNTRILRVGVGMR